MSVDIEIAGYDLIREIGSGGMARVFLATQTSLGREVAIKVLRRSLSGGEDFQRRFLHEGQLLAKLNHPNIVPIHDIGQTNDAFYMAMEFLQGGTLSETMKDGLSVAEIIRICTQIAHALQLAHRHNIVHRDLKPSNIMFRDELTPVLTDFGIARKTDADHRLTKTGMVVGTPYYMSPEQITGKDIDGRADLYSLGIMFYELLTGALPFKAEEPLALAMQHVQEAPPPVPGDLAELQPIMDSMLAKNPDDRYPDMLSFCRAIKDLVLNEKTFAEKLTGETRLFNSDQFSDPRFGSGGLQVPERVTRDIAAATTGRRKPPGATQVSRETARPTGGPARNRWLLPAIGVTAALMLGVGLFQVFKGDSSGISESQRVVADTYLDQVDAYLTLGRIDQPPGENALDTLNKVLEIAPQYSRVAEYRPKIAAFIEVDARKAFNERDLETAADRVTAGLAVAPDYESLLQLKTEIDSRMAALQRQRQITDLLFEAETYASTGALIDPPGSNAVESYQQVLDLDPLNESATQGRRRIQESVVAQINMAIQTNALAQAEAQLTRAQELFGNSSLVNATRQNLDNERRRQREELQVSDLLAQAETLKTSGNLVDPAGDSAADRYQAVLILRPDNQAAEAGLVEIAQGFERRAREAAAAEDFNTAVDLANAGLRAIPELPSLVEIQQTATAALDAEAREIQERLQTAESLANAEVYLAEDGQDALNAYQRVLEIDPENIRARGALNRLPDRIYDTASQMQRAGQFADASLLVSRATATYPDDPRFPALSGLLDTALEEQAQQQRLSQLLAQSRRLINASPLTTDSITEAADSLKQIIQEFPNELEVVSQIGDLTTAIAAQANRMSRDGSDEAALGLLGAGLEQFPSNNSMTQMRDTIVQRQQRRIQEEQARIAAISGQLSIDAAPWGEVVEIRSVTGDLFSLPRDTTTPLTLSLVEGDYRVQVRGGNGSSPVTLDVTVERQQTVTTRAQFTTMSADSYFERSGW
ncbi:MAG: protein kinase [Xanthomonadales bacterium]|nr:protein kinase [Xanthomonadales bacterium]